MKLRLKLFDIVITPSILFGLSTLPVHQVSLDKIDGTQRKMLRKIAGWVRYPTETWETTMRRMKYRVTRALIQYPITDWSKRIHGMKAKMVRRIENLPLDRWEVKSSKWLPANVHDDSQEFYAFRDRGRPPLRWNDNIRESI